MVVKGDGRPHTITPAGTVMIAGRQKVAKKEYPMQSGKIWSHTRPLEAGSGPLSGPVDSSEKMV